MTAMELHSGHFFIRSFGGRKAETGSVVVLLPGPQNGIGKVWVVGCVGETLCFQAEGVMLAVFRTALALTDGKA